MISSSTNTGAKFNVVCHIKVKVRLIYISYCYSHIGYYCATGLAIYQSLIFVSCLNNKFVVSIFKTQKIILNIKCLQGGHQQVINRWSTGPFRSFGQSVHPSVRMLPELVHLRMCLPVCVLSFFLASGCVPLGE